MFSVIGVDMTPIPDPCCLFMSLFIQFNWLNCVIYNKFLFYNLHWIQACDYEYKGLVQECEKYDEYAHKPTLVNHP